MNICVNITTYFDKYNNNCNWSPCTQKGYVILSHICDNNGNVNVALQAQIFDEKICKNMHIFMKILLVFYTVLCNLQPQILPIFSYFPTKIWYGHVKTGMSILTATGIFCQICIFWHKLILFLAMLYSFLPNWTYFSCILTSYFDIGPIYTQHVQIWPMSK